MSNVTVIVPVYNDAIGIKKTIRSLLSSIPGQLIIVDNGSTDRTPEIVRNLIDDIPCAALFHETSIQSSYAARNKGIRESSNDVLAFVDADMTVPEDWLENSLQEMRVHDAAYMGCNVELTLPKHPSFAARYDAHTGFPVEQYLERQHFSPTCCLFVRREVFDDIGLFDYRLISGGDKEFGNRVHEAGYNMHFAKDVFMYHPVRDSLQALVKKDFRVGRGLCQLQRYHPDRYGEPGVPPRPSGVKSPDKNLPRRDRLAFGVLSKMMTAVRGLGYYREYVDNLHSANDESLPDTPDLEPDE